MHDEIQVHGFLPVDVGIADRQFLAVLAEHVDLGLEFRQIPRRRLHVLLTHEEEQIVAVDGVLRLEEEVTDEQVCPVRSALEHDESGVWRRRENLRVCKGDSSRPARFKDMSSVITTKFTLDRFDERGVAGQRGGGGERHIIMSVRGGKCLAIDTCTRRELLTDKVREAETRLINVF